MKKWPSASDITGRDTDLPVETRSTNITPLHSVPSSTFATHVMSCHMFCAFRKSDNQYGSRQKSIRAGYG